jgi:DNA mismatch repair ATPase MutS
VRNDVALGGERRVLMVSGSNMSGKTTLLRSVGVAAVLGLAGAPVCAERLRLSRVRVAASIHVRDSLLEGRSRFYAEIRRLRQVVGLAESDPPVLFLLDEILHGTNSHDRGIGAEAVVRGLVERGALGLVTTHDLALARVAEALAPRGANVHFEDHLEEGHMAFDYRVREGVVTRSNALELMRSVGLDV